MKDCSFAHTTPDGLSLHIHGFGPEGAPKAALQIVHGMGEHGARYARLAERFTAAGFVVYATDQRGHGKSALPGKLGCMGGLDAWDRAGNVDSRGAVLFIKWVEAMEGITGQGQPSLRPDWFAIPWDQDKPLTTPRGLQDPQKAVAALQSAANEVRKTYGTLDVPYGDVYRIRRGEADAPSPVAHQSFGSFAAGLFNKDEDNRYSIVGGQTFVAVVEFGKTVRAEGVLAYGNSSEPSSPHYSDQVDLFSRNKFRTLLRQRSEIEKQTEERERF